MSNDTASKGSSFKRVDARIKINLKYSDQKDFAKNFSPNISHTGIFVRTTKPAPVGSRIYFEYLLSDQSRVLRGAGIVRIARKKEQAEEQGLPPGMSLEFIDLDPSSDTLVNQIVAQHGEGKYAPKKQSKANPQTPVKPSVAQASTAPAPVIVEKLDAEEQSALDSLLDEGLLSPPFSTSSNSKEEKLDSQTTSSGWLLDISSYPWQSSELSASPENRVQHQPLHVEYKDDKWCFGKTGVPLTELIHALAVPQSLVFNEMYAQKLKLELVNQSNDFNQIKLNDQSVNLNDLWLEFLAYWTEHQKISKTVPMIIIIPESLTHTRLKELEQFTKDHGYEQIQIQSMTQRICDDPSLALHNEQLLLLVQIRQWFCQILLIEFPANIVDIKSLWGAGYVHLHRICVNHLKIQALQECDPDALKDQLLDTQLKQALAEVENGDNEHAWQIKLKSSTLSVSPNLHQKWCESINEQIILQAEHVLSANCISFSDLQSIVLVSANNLIWPGLSKTFQKHAAITIQTLKSEERNNILLSQTIS